MRRCLALALLLACAAPAQSQTTEVKEKATERWYEIKRSGHKLGYTRVVWAPSTWEGKKTVHDTTTVFRRSVRNMAGVKTVFETSISIDLERSADGTLWMQKTEVNEAGRISTETLTWTGKGYTKVIKVGNDPAQTREYPIGEPVMTDGESFLTEKVRAGQVKQGDAFELRLLDERRQTARNFELKIAGKKTIDVLGKPVECLKLLQRDPESGVQDVLWIDPTGAFVALELESGTTYHQVTAAQAKDMPVEPAQYSVTTPSNPPLERIFTADRHLLDWHLQGDATRKLPELPDSPWSRMVSKSGSDEEGWVLKLELKKYDAEDTTGTFPVDAERFKDDLEPTPLMPADHPTIKAKAREIVGDEKNLRKAAYKLARYVHGSLQKRSPDVGSTTALEILQQGMGDCSEHCVLFVTLCRAAGIPARRCSGYVNIGSMWGAHAWAEIWVGEWIGADPTTGEVGCGARYVFFGYPDRAGSYPGVISSRIEGRMRFVSTRIEEGDRSHDISKPAGHRIHDVENARYVHALAGIELVDVPAGWRVSLSGDNHAQITTPSMSVSLRASGDQGYGLERMGGANTTFCGAPARSFGGGRRQFFYAHARRRLIQMTITGGDEEERAKLAEVLAPTFAPKLTPPAETPEAPPEKKAPEPVAPGAGQ